MSHIIQDPLLCMGILDSDIPDNPNPDPAKGMIRLSEYSINPIHMTHVPSLSVRHTCRIICCNLSTHIFQLQNLPAQIRGNKDAVAALVVITLYFTCDLIFHGKKS